VTVRPPTPRSASVENMKESRSEGSQPRSERPLWWNNFWREMRSAIRALSRERAFAAFAVLLIGLGAGLLTTMFAIVDAVTLRKLDVPDPDLLINIVALREGKETSPRYAVYERLKENLDSADSLCATSNTFVPVTYDGRTVMVFTLYVTDDYYRMMGARPVLGRTLTPADDGPVAVISDTYWRRIGRDNAVIGKMIRAGSMPLTIVGVVPASAHEFWRFSNTDMVVPFRIGMLLESVPPERVFRYNVDVTARLIKGLTLPQVQQRLDALWPRLLAETIPPGQSLEEWTRAAGAQARVLPGSRGHIWTDEKLPRAAVALFVLAGLVLLAMCSNLACLLLYSSAEPGCGSNSLLLLQIITAEAILQRGVGASNRVGHLQHGRLQDRTSCLRWQLECP
jgi:hypothetical protein